MTQPDPAVLQFIDRYHRFVVIGHMEPDPDCLCSSLALASILNRYGKQATAANEGPFVRSDLAPYVPQLTPIADALSDKAALPDALIIVDCSSLKRLGAGAAPLADLPTLTIDHHTVNEGYGTVQYLDPHAPSCTLLIYRLAVALRLPLTENEAQLLFYGFCTDTGYFKHLNPDHFSDLIDVAALMQAGAAPKTAFRQMSHKSSVSSFQLLSDLMQRTEFLHQHQIAFVYDTEADLKKYGKEAFNADLLYTQLFGVEGVEAIIYLKYKAEGLYTVGLRSLSKINVGQLAHDLGGGGHQLAAGAKIEGDPEALKPILLKKILNPAYAL